MTTERASIFDEDLDVSGFAPKPRAKAGTTDKEAIREVAESRGFQSREPEGQGKAADPAPRQRRRHTTGRNRQLNIKATESTVSRFYALADANGWVLGEAFELAVAALEREAQRK